MSTVTLHSEKKKTLVPQLRFQEFDGEWNNSNLGEAFTIFNGYAFSSSLSVEDGVLWVKIADVGIQEMKKNNLSYLPISLKEKHKKFILTKGDFVVALTRPILNGKLKIAQINSFFDGALLNQRVGKIISNNSHYFIYSLLQKDELIKSIENNIAGSDPPNLSPNEINSIEISFPPLPEQQKIASFLSAVDEKIQQLSRKKELLEQYKKGVMEQLFSGKLRFKDENGEDYADWEEKKLGEVFKIGSGKDYKNLEKGNIPVFGTGGYMLSVNKFLHSGETVFIGRKGTIDKPFYFNGEFWTVDTLFYTHTFKNVTPKFIYCVFQQINWKLHNEASGVPSLSKSTIEKLTFDFPCIEEQQKIADFLSSIDAKIESTNQQITQTQSFKKGLLQQMFV